MISENPAETIRLKRLLASAAGNKHHQAVILIEALLSDGPLQGQNIVARAAALGLSRQHVGIILRHDAGPNPERHRWDRDDDGNYRLH